MKKLSHQDWKALVRLASDMPKGSEPRRAILRSLKASYTPDRWEMRRRSEAAWLSSQGKQCHWTFRTPALEMLWNEHCVGQISDGAWENSPRAGWEFWANIPTSVGGNTSLKGTIPFNIMSGFNFIKEVMPYTGDEMLDDIKKFEPGAVMADVARYLKEIQTAIRNAKTGKEEAEKKVVDKTEQAPDTLNSALLRSRLLKVTSDAVGAKPVPETEAFLFAPTGSRAGKYHYFVMYPHPGGFGWVAVTAHGKVNGAGPKAVDLSKGKRLNRSEAEDLLVDKARDKINSGYTPTPMDGIRRELKVF